MKKQDSPFVFVGNNVAVDFVNTEIVRRGQLVDLIQNNADLVQWAHAADLNLDSGVTAADVTKVLEFRRALKGVFAAKIDGLPASRKALAKINQHLANHSTRQVLRYKKNGYVLQSMQEVVTIPTLLGELAYEAATLLASSRADRLKRCSSPDCVLIFLDTSRSQKRRWCSMETCGNRAKVSTHYRKTQS